MLRSRISLLALSAAILLPTFASAAVSTRGTSTADAEATPPPASSTATKLSIEALVNSSKATRSVVQTPTASSGGASGSASGSNSGTSFGGIAAGLTVKPSSFFGIEGNLALLSKKFDSSSSDQSSDEDTYKGQASDKFLTLRATGLARVYLVPEFSIGVGPYVSTFLGSIRHTSSDGEVTNTGYSENYLKRTDYGMALGARAEIPMSPKLDFVVDARYFLGFANLTDIDRLRSDLTEQLGGSAEAREFADSIDATTKTRDLQLAAGIAIKF